jgi:hypothetical protein
VLAAVGLDVVVEVVGVVTAVVVGVVTVVFETVVVTGGSDPVR